MTSVSSGYLVRKHRRPAGDAQHATGMLDEMVRASLPFPKEKDQPFGWSFLFGAGDEARTRYLHLGKVALYRMSYARNGHALL